MLLDLAAILVAISAAILAAFMIPALIEIRKTAVAVRDLTVKVENDMKPVLDELHGTLSEVKGLVSEASARIEEVKNLTTAMGETGRNLRAINGVIGSAAGVLTTTSIWAAGAKAAGRLIVERLAKKRKGEG
jgi:uncharacterized protein YoxC